MIGRLISSFRSRSIIGLASLALIGTIIGKLFRYLINYVIGSGFNAEVLGVFTFGIVLIRAISMLSSVGLRTSSQKFISIYRTNEDWESLFGTALIIFTLPLVLGTLFGFLVYNLWPTIASIIGIGIDSNVRLYLVGVPFFSVMYVTATATRGLKETKYFVYIREVGQSGLALLLIGIVTYVISDSFLLPYFYIGSLVFGCLISVWVFWKTNVFRTGVHPKFNLIDILSVSLPLLIVASSQYLISWADILLIGIMQSAEEVGYYQVAFLYAVLVNVPFQGINAVFPSIAAEYYEDNKMKNLERVYSSTTKWALYVTSVISIIVVFYPVPLLRIFGEEFSAGAAALVILVIGRVVASIPGPASYILSMSEYEKLESINTLAFGILNVILNFILINIMGIMGAALATSIALIGMNTSRLVEVWKLLGIHPFHRSYFKGIIAISATILVTLVINILISGLIGMVIAGAISSCTFIIILYILGIDEHDEHILQAV